MRDVSTKPNIAEALLNLTVEVKKLERIDVRSHHCAACSDNDGNARKMRRLVLERTPSLIVFLC